MRADVPAMKGWRRELFGEKALSLKKGRLALALEKGRVTAVERRLTSGHRRFEGCSRSAAPSCTQPACRPGRRQAPRISLRIRSTSRPRSTRIGVFGSTPGIEAETI